jgi:hypothetical protein
MRGDAVTGTAGYATATHLLTGGRAPAPLFVGGTNCLIRNGLTPIGPAPERSNRKRPGCKRPAGRRLDRHPWTSQQLIVEATFASRR